jgi:hypothetical protein
MKTTNPWLLVSIDAEKLEFLKKLTRRVCAFGMQLPRFEFETRSRRISTAEDGAKLWLGAQPAAILSGCDLKDGKTT